MIFIQRGKNKIKKTFKIAEGTMGHHQIDYNVHDKGPHGDNRENGAESLLKEMAENFPNLEKETDIQGQEVPKKKNSNGHTLTHIINKLSKVKDKERILKSPRGKTTCFTQGNPCKTMSRLFFAEMLQTRREWHNIFKGLKDKNCEPKIQLSSYSKSLIGSATLRKMTL